jgi:hypothetical protein
MPIEGVVTSSWKKKVFEQVNGKTKINRHYYELCVLEKLERALKCKEVRVEGSYDFRNCFAMAGPKPARAAHPDRC